MGQSLNIICRDCKVDQYLGYGSSHMHIGGCNHHLGDFREEEDAAVAYNIAAQLLYEEFAYLNDV